MNILGYEIKRARTTAEPNPGSASVNVTKANQATLPSVPLNRAYPRAELGDSGTRTIHGIIGEEYNATLQGIQGIKIYDEMRKSDGTVRAAMLVTTLPIRRAQWFVNPSSEDQQDKEIAAFVEHALFDWIEDMTWDDVVRQALLMTAFGVMCFEKVYGVKEFEGKTYVTIEKLAPRLPKSIMQWELPDRTFGIQQIRQDGVIALIPGSKMLIFVNEREGDNWWGTSMLRAAYKHWYYKNNFYKIDAMAFERQGLGVPTIKMPPGYTESDERKATQAMQNLRANENQFLLIPTGYEFEFADMGATTTRDPATSIAHHNREILKSVLAQFIELGSQQKSGGTGGSRALSNDHSDLFLKAIEAIANTITAEINKKLIPELVDMNFNDVKVYPVLDYSGISKVDMEGLANAYGALVTAKGINPTLDDEQYLRSALGLPARSQEDIEQAEKDESAAEEALEGPSSEEQEDHINVDPTATGGDAKPVEDAADKSSQDQAPADTKKDNKTVDIAAKKKANEWKVKRKFSAADDFTSWRKLTFTEKKVNWNGIQDTIDNLEKNFSMEATELLKEAKDAYMKKLHDAIESGDQQAIIDLEVKFESDYKALLKTYMKEAYMHGKNSVSSELGVAVPPSTSDTMKNIDLMADTIAAKTKGDIEAKAKLAAGNALKADQSPHQASGTIDAMLDDYIGKAVTSTAGVIVARNINSGRNDVLERNAEDLHGIQRSEVMDKATCDFCLSMDGLVVMPGDPWAMTDTFHDNCRGIWVGILLDEQNPPDITGVPDEIGDYYGGQPNALVQPPKPILLPGSPAEEEVQRRKDEKAKK